MPGQRAGGPWKDGASPASAGASPFACVLCVALRLISARVFPHTAASPRATAACCARRRLAGALCLPAFALVSGVAAAACGERIELPAHDGTRQHYALTLPAAGADIALLLLAGGSGHLALDDDGCPGALTGNALVRMRPLFLAAGFVTAYADAPSDYRDEDGLGGFRTAPAHAADLGRIVADLRRRTAAAVWIVGTSRGAISAANAAARLQGDAAPAGVVLTSPVSIGTAKGRKSWVAQTVFDTPLAAIRMPLLVVGHRDDGCLRSPADQLERIAAQTGSARRQVVTVGGGAGGAHTSGLAACEGRSPHGFVGQDEEVAAGIARFIRGGQY